jgi:hypothetical protein
MEILGIVLIIMFGRAYLDFNAQFLVGFEFLLFVYVINSLFASTITSALTVKMRKVMAQHEAHNYDSISLLHQIHALIRSYILIIQRINCLHLYFISTFTFLLSSQHTTLIRKINTYVLSSLVAIKSDEQSLSSSFKDSLITSLVNTSYAAIDTVFDDDDDDDDDDDE